MLSPGDCFLKTSLNLFLLSHWNRKPPDWGLMQTADLCLNYPTNRAFSSLSYDLKPKPHSFVVVVVFSGAFFLQQVIQRSILLAI